MTHVAAAILMTRLDASRLSWLHGVNVIMLPCGAAKGEMHCRSSGSTEECPGSWLCKTYEAAVDVLLCRRRVFVPFARSHYALLYMFGRRVLHSATVVEACVRGECAVQSVHEKQGLGCTAVAFLPPLLMHLMRCALHSDACCAL